MQAYHAIRENCAIQGNCTELTLFCIVYNKNCTALGQSESSNVFMHIINHKNKHWSSKNEDRQKKITLSGQASTLNTVQNNLKLRFQMSQSTLKKPYSFKDAMAWHYPLYIPFISTVFVHSKKET